MVRSRSILLLAILVGSSFAFSAARADAPLAADAGDSKAAYNGAALALAGKVFGGVAPYSYAWSWAGDPGRFTGANAPNATFNTAGLHPQNLPITLTITDANGAVATDTILHRVESAPIIFRASVNVTGGVPDEFLGVSVDDTTVDFEVPPATARIVAVLDWRNGVTSYDLDLELLDPSQNVAGDGQGETDRRPERVVVDDPAAGTWTARIMPFLSGPTVANITVQAFPSASLPRVSFESPVRFGLLQEQRVTASATGSSVSVSWDLEADGTFDATGMETVVSLALGAHPVRIRAIDAHGFRATTTGVIEVVDSDAVLRLRCGGEGGTPYKAMEFSASKGTCWIHSGHQTYFTGAHRFGFRHLSGFVYSVEQQFSPPTEFVTADPGVTPIHLEVSEDGLAWTEIGIGSYQFLPDVLDGSLALQERQFILVEATGSGESFRYLRAREPLSAAQGLSGYLDMSAFDVRVDILDPVDEPTLAPGTRTLDCAAGDHLEDFFAAHPCWFGGIDRYDAPSFFHTYPIGEGASLNTINGSFTLLPWRLDDWTQGDSLTNATNVSAYVQTSIDGVHWTDVAVVPTTFGTTTPFHVALDHQAARFVRFFPEEHARFDQTAEFAPNHHPKGYFVDSRVTVEGVLPTA